jgi:VWFA-related protein
LKSRKVELRFTKRCGLCWQTRCAVAELTGGQTFRAEKASDLSGVYKQVAAAIKTVYSVGYYPANAERDGTYRRVRVNVNRPDAAVRARKGYYAK